MLTPDPQTKHLLTIEISSELYEELQAQIQATGSSESELVTQGLRYVLERDKKQDLEGDRFDRLAANLEQKLKLYVEELVRSSLPQNRQTQLEQADRDQSNQINTFNTSNHSENNLETLPNAAPMPLPTIRPLQIGDRVLVLEPDSPYYMAKVLIVKTSLIRATVATETGEYSFLKRDLRFIESTD